MRSTRAANLFMYYPDLTLQEIADEVCGQYDAYDAEDCWHDVEEIQLKNLVLTNWLDKFW
jgi:hypothetical protein